MDLLDGIDFACPDCGHRSRYPLVHSGKSVACPSCKRNHVLPAPAPESALPVAPAPRAAKPPANEAEKILFVCGSCHYRARIPGQYAGMAVRCPSCDAAQIANPDSSGGTTGSTVQLSKVPTAGHKTTIRAGNILFICSLCNFEAQLAKHYVGKAIRCPGCHAPQVVAGEAPTQDPLALERNVATASAAGEASAPVSDPRFICVGCGYRARIPSQYMGLAVTCPKCDTVQIATPEEQEGPSTGDTVSIARMKTAEDGAKIANPQVTTSSGFTSRNTAVKSTLPPAPAPTANSGDKSTEKGGDKVRFTCSACGFKARIPSAYAGENIHCPGCNAVQLVLRSGQLSPNATGNTQIIQVVQTAEAAASPDAIATPTHTPARGLPVISDEPPKAKPLAAPAPVIAKPALPSAPPIPPAPKPVNKFTTPPPPAVPVAQPVGTAAAEATIDDLLSFEDPSASEAPKPTGKVVRRGSDRLNAVSTKTPLPGESSKTAKTPLPMEPAKATVNYEIQADSQADAAQAVPSSPSKSAPTFVPKAAPKAAPAVAAVSAAHPQPKASMVESAPAKQSNALIIVVAIIGLGLFAIVGVGGWMVMGQLSEQKLTLAEQTKALTEQTKTLADMQEKLNSAKVEIEATNKKLTKAEDETKLAKEAAETAAKKQAEEAAARKASEEKAVELEAKLKAAEEAAVKTAAEAKAASQKAASEKSAPVEVPK